MRRFPILLVLSCLILSGLVGPKAASASATTGGGLEAESLALAGSKGQPYDDGSASGGRALLIWSNGAATGNVTTSAATSIIVRAKGDQCDGAPVMRVDLDGREVLRTPVPSTGWDSYSVPVPVPAGTHTVAVAFTNDHSKRGCDRNLRVDSVSFSAAPAANGSVEGEALALASWAGQAFDDASASAQRALLLWTNATASGSVSTPAAGSISVRARGDQCDGAPLMTVQLNGGTVLDVVVSSSSWATYSAPIAVPAGTHAIAVSFTNDHSNWGCDRNLRVDSISLSPTATPESAAVESDPFEGRQLYVDPASAARRQADAWRSSRPLDAALMDRVAAGATAAWFGEWSGDVAVAVDRHVAAASAADALPVLVAYRIPQRDCGGWSAGGSDTPDAYRSWIGAFARGIGDRSAVVVLEPDALAQLPCLSAADQSTRLALLRDAVAVLEARPGVSVYLDAGHSSWVPVDEMASRLIAAGITAGQGFALNVSNYQSTADSVRYARELSSRVGGKGAVIDTSRNGLGSNGEWCNALGRALGPVPTAATADQVVDAYLWVKTPGESDGECNGGPQAGAWWPEYALGLAARAAGGS